MRSNLTVFALCASVLGMSFAGCTSRDAAGAATEASPPPAVVREARTAIGTIHPTIVVPGAIAPQQTVSLSNSIDEPAATVTVREGDRVRAGEVIAQLDVDDLEASLAAARQTARADAARSDQAAFTARLAFDQAPDQVRESRAQVDQALQTLVEAKRNLGRDAALQSEGYLPSQNVDEQRVVVQSDEAALRSAQAQLQSSASSETVNGTPQRGLQASQVAAASADASAQSATAEQLQRQIARATITSPIDGIVVNRNLNPGEYPSGRQIFTIEAVDSVYAILTASAVQAYEIRTGDDVAIARAGLAGLSARGRVEALLDPATAGSTNYTIKVAVPNPGDVLRAGTPVQGIVDLGAVRGVAIPSGAFADDARDSVVLDIDGRARHRTVREIATDGLRSIVGGLPSGARVVTDGTAQLDEGARVRAER